jgi:hypothetical protein
MASQGPNYPGTTSEITDGTAAWGTPDNVKASDTSYAAVLLGQDYA